MRTVLRTPAGDPVATQHSRSPASSVVSTGNSQSILRRRNSLGIRRRDCKKQTHTNPAAIPVRRTRFQPNFTLRSIVTDIHGALRDNFPFFQRTFRTGAGNGTCLERNWPNGKSQLAVKSRWHFLDGFQERAGAPKFLLVHDHLDRCGVDEGTRSSRYCKRVCPAGVAWSATCECGCFCTPA